MAVDQQLENLKQKYQAALSAIQQHGVRLQHLHVENGKLVMQGEAPSEEAKNRVWDAIKSADQSYSDLKADIKVNPSLAPAQQAGMAGAGQAGGVGGGLQTYTVQAGDTLSKIAQRFYGDSSQYNKIFEANRDQLSNPDKIQAGQQLKIPAK